MIDISYRIKAKQHVAGDQLRIWLPWAVWEELRQLPDEVYFPTTRVWHYVNLLLRKHNLERTEYPR